MQQKNYPLLLLIQEPVSLLITLAQSSAHVAAAVSGALRVSEFEDHVVSGLEAGDDGAELGRVADRALVDRDDHHSLRVAEVDLVGEGAGFDGLDDDPVQSCRSAL